MPYTTTIDRETAWDRFARRHPLWAIVLGVVLFPLGMVAVVIAGIAMVIALVCLVVVEGVGQASPRRARHAS